MKRFFWPFLLLGFLLITPSCTKPYNEKLDELQERLDKLQKLCDEINENIAGIRSLVEAIEAQDMITGLTELRSGSTVTGYKINFVKHDPVTIYNGSDGKKPLVASKQDPATGNYYWTVQYGDGKVEWMLDPDGNKMLATGLLPMLKIIEGYWYYTTNGADWVLIGKADGDNGDTMFQSFDTSSSQFVVITLSNGEVLKIPTYAAWLGLKNDFDRVNRNVDAQVKLIDAMYNNLVYIVSVKPIRSSGKQIGTSVSLSNGQNFSIYDWTASVTPTIFIKQDVDGNYYWAYEIAGGEEQWVLFMDEKVPASRDAIEAPVVDVMLDSDGHYYWTVTWNGQTDILRYKIGLDYSPFAIDSVQRIFSEVTEYTDSLVVVLREGQTRFVLPKQYTVSIYDEDGLAAGDTLVMREIPGGDERILRYVANGSGVSLSLLSQGGFRAVETSEGGLNYIRIKAPATFTSGSGKIMAVFTFGSEPAPITVVRNFIVIKED